MTDRPTRKPTRAEKAQAAKDKAQALATRILAINIERVAAKQILSDIVDRGLTPELREKGRYFLERHPD